MKHRLVDGAYAAGWAVVRGMPTPVAAASFDLAGRAAAAARGRRVRRLAANYRRVLGSAASEVALQRLVVAGMRSYTRYWREVFRLPTIPPAEIVNRMEVTDEWRLREAYAAGRGVILALPHTGNWDQAGAWCVLTGMPFATVAERLEPAALFDRFVAFREGLGMEVLPLTGGARPPYELLADRLRAGGMLCLLADRDLTARGVDVDFFGARARMPAGPASLARQTGAALLPATLWFTAGGWGARLHPQVEPAGRPDDIAVMTQQTADAFAEGIAAHPQDWHMLQRLWLDDFDHLDARADGVIVGAAQPPVLSPAGQGR